MKLVRSYENSNNVGTLHDLEQKFWTDFSIYPDKIFVIGYRIYNTSAYESRWKYGIVITGKYIKGNYRLVDDKIKNFSGSLYVYEFC